VEEIRLPIRARQDTTTLMEVEIYVPSNLSLTEYFKTCPCSRANFDAFFHYTLQKGLIFSVAYKGLRPRDCNVNVFKPVIWNFRATFNHAIQ
jgi:hypothetical protein